MTKNDLNIDDLLVENYIVPESVFDRKRTKTSHFMLNTVFYNSSLTSTEYFVNAYLDDGDLAHKIFRPLFLLFKVAAKDRKWADIAPRLRAKSEYLMEYFCGINEGKHLIMMIFQVPDKFAKDYLFFKHGKYSQFSPEYKKLFNRYTANEKAQPIESTVWRVIHKSTELKKELELYFGEPVKFTKEDELWGRPEPKYEIYRYKPEN
jgi:hypothetical protein